MTATRTYRLTCRGNTQPAKESLKARGWKWNPTAKHWYLILVAAHAQRIIDGDDEFFRGLGGHKKGCQLCLDGNVVWTSKTFGESAAPQTTSRTVPDQDGYGWNVDAAGNPVRTQAIPGSSPDDRV